MSFKTTHCLNVPVHFGGSSIAVNMLALKYFGQTSFQWPLLFWLLCILLVLFWGSVSAFQSIGHIHSRSTAVLSSSLQDKFMIPSLLPCHIFSFERTVFYKHSVSLILKFIYLCSHSSKDCSGKNHIYRLVLLKILE